MKEIIEKLKNHKVVQCTPQLVSLVKKLEKQYKHEEKIDSQYGAVISYMADGMGYDDAMNEAGLNDGY